MFDRNVLLKIVSAINLLKSDRVLEIGAGFGNLTQHLARYCEFVLAIEMDKRIAPLLERETSSFENVETLIGDAMKMDLGKFALDNNLNRMVSNLPYSIAASVILKVLLDCPGIMIIHCAVQKEIAQRMTAKPGEKNYSGYTAKIKYLSEPKNLFDISRNSFFPAPGVDSSFVEIKRRKSLDEKVNTLDFFNFVDACFASRRKTLANSLTKSPNFNFPKQKVEAELTALGFSENTRAERFDTKTLMLLYKRLL
ncbi:MAG: 16S rRNA (adenine(1518)-N(6)/adenine(1519)-N(6))-dimethyltransferase RsmA [Actinobacteria bacterium]|nr:16S rRNA (adenine(1518)-N(6)/adenine(1519)-N(6))-dimethyltransferase RsmA [Actinomycetota bacterium]